MYIKRKITLFFLVSILFIGCGGGSSGSSSNTSSSNSTSKGSSPSVSSTSPKNNDINITTSSNITVTFDMSMLESTINSENIFLTKLSDNSSIQATVTYDSSSKTATLNPDNDLSNNNFYKLTVQKVKNSLSSDEIINPATIYFMVGEELTFNSKIYKVIKSPITGKNWLDRNIGANGVCTSSGDTNCLGEYYQWGRLKDGHEQRDVASTTTKASSISNVGHAQFIANTTGGDWVDDGVDDDGSLRKAQWSKTDGTTVCPKYFRVPNYIELESDTFPSIENTSIGQVQIKNVATAFQSFLKFPNQNARLDTNATYNNLGNVPLVWTNFPDPEEYARRMSDYPHTVGDGYFQAKRANAGAIRCIQADF